MKSKKLHLCIPLELYHYDVIVSIGETNAELKRKLKKYGLDESGFKALEVRENCSGRAVTFEHLAVIRMNEFNGTAGAYSTLNHEMFHVTAAMLRGIGLKLSKKTEEGYAYLISYLTTKIYPKL